MTDPRSDTNAREWHSIAAMDEPLSLSLADKEFNPEMGTFRSGETRVLVRAFLVGDQ